MTRMVYLVSPNNPTGVTWHEQEIAGLCARHPNVVFIVDEAYHEFCGQSVVQLTRKYSNLAVTRTFSKAFGLAAFRVGYVVAHPSLCDHLLRLHNPKSVNAVAQVAATAAAARAAVSETISFQASRLYGPWANGGVSIHMG